MLFLLLVMVLLVLVVVVLVVLVAEAEAVTDPAAYRSNIQQMKLIVQNIRLATTAQRSESVMMVEPSLKLMKPVAMSSANPPVSEDENDDDDDDDDDDNEAFLNMLLPL